MNSDGNKSKATIEVSRVIDATPQRLYELVSDLPRMGEWSNENRGGRWLRGATAASVGARFRGRNRNGWRRWTTVAKVTTADPARAFVFDVSSFGLKIARWGYLFEAVDGGTKVTETWLDQRNSLFGKVTGLVVGVRDRHEFNSKGMERTLERLGAAA